MSGRAEIAALLSGTYSAPEEKSRLASIWRVARCHQRSYGSVGLAGRYALIWRE